MLKLCSAHIKRPSVLRRIIFAASHLPSDLPDLWELIVSFGTYGSKDTITSEEAKLLGSEC